MANFLAKFILLCLCAGSPMTALSAESNLASALGTDFALQETTLIAVRSALGGRDNTAVVRRGGFLADLRIYIETYRGLRDANTLRNIQSRYSAAKAELLEPRLPDSMHELIAILETLY